MLPGKRLIRRTQLALLLFCALLIQACSASLKVASSPPRAPVLKEGPPGLVGMDPGRLARLDGVIEEAIADSTIPGAVVLIARAGTIVYHRAYGNRAVVPQQERMTLDTVFDMASVSKPMSSAASVMKLVEMGRVRLQDRVSVYLPEFDEAEKGQIRVAQLLTHTSGLAPYAPVDSIASQYGRPTVEGVWNWIVEHPPRHEPGERFLYSDLNYVTLAHLVHRVSGRPLNEFAEDMIYRPLGMSDTGFFPPVGSAARIAPTEQLEDRVLRGEVHDPLARLQGGVGGSAGLFSTAADVAVFAQMLLNGGEYDGVRIFSPLTVRAMTTVQIMGRGFGFDVLSPYSNLRGDLLARGSFGHTGYTGTSLWIDPSEELIVVLMTNRVHPTDTTSVVPLRSKVSNVVAASIIGPPPDLP
jgi:CubicO group peptidase (beta-lactamase class C family)